MMGEIRLLAAQCPKSLDYRPPNELTNCWHCTKTSGRLRERQDTIGNAKGGKSVLTMSERNATLSGFGHISFTRNDEVTRRSWNQYGHVTKKECN